MQLRTPNMSTHPSGVAACPGSAGLTQAASKPWLGVALGALGLALAGTSGAQTLPDVKTPQVQCSVLASALDIQADAELPAQQKAAAGREMKGLVSSALQSEYDKLKSAKPGASAETGMNRVAAVCAQVLYPAQRPEQFKRCGSSWRQVGQVAVLHKHGMPREEALSIAHTMSGTEGSKPSAADVKLVNFVYAYSPEAMREPQAMLRVAGAWLNQCLTATK